MAYDVPFRLRLTGGDADESRMPAYDGFTSIAGFALSLSLVTNYVHTGEIRRRGDFVGRGLVKAHPLTAGSVVSDFTVLLGDIAVISAASALGPTIARQFFNDIFKRTLDRNIGQETQPQTDLLRELERKRGGDLEALVAATEPSIKQAHSVIGEGVQIVNIFGGKHQLSTFNLQTKEYVESTIQDDVLRSKDVSVASFNVNSGYGGVFDSDLNRIVPIKLTKETLRKTKGVLSWGLDQYARGTGKKITLNYFSLLALDGTVKKYIVVDANVPTK